LFSLKHLTLTTYRFHIYKGAWISQVGTGPGIKLTFVQVEFMENYYQGAQNRVDADGRS
jgi:hypothetical protein